MTYEEISLSDNDNGTDEGPDDSEPGYFSSLATSKCLSALQYKMKVKMAKAKAKKVLKVYKKKKKVGSQSQL